MSNARYFFPSYEPPPDGYGYFDKYSPVAGCNHYREDAAAFVASGSRQIELDREPDNPHDGNAIRVLGCTKGILFTKRRHIGCIRAETAEIIAKYSLFPHLRTRLCAIQHRPETNEEPEYIKVVVQLLLPTMTWLRYKEAVREERKRERAVRALALKKFEAEQRAAAQARDS
jgi:hypothetical protein